MKERKIGQGHEGKDEVRIREKMENKTKDINSNTI